MNAPSPASDADASFPPARGVLHATGAVATAVLVLSSVACGTTGPSEQERHADELEAARSLWRSAELPDYRYRVRQLCFCGYGGQLLEVEVREGVTVAATLVDTGEEIPEEQLRWTAPSVEDLFDRLAEILNRGPAAYDASFDSDLGYPVSAMTDPIANAVDDEWGFEASDLVPD